LLGRALRAFPELRGVQGNVIERLITWTGVSGRGTRAL